MGKQKKPVLQITSETNIALVMMALHHTEQKIISVMKYGQIVMVTQQNVLLITSETNIALRIKCYTFTTIPRCFKLPVQDGVILNNDLHQNRNT